MPGPRCSNVAAGFPVILPMPSAAPVHTPSNKARTDLTLGTASKPCTKCISEVPGFAMQNSTPQSASVLISAVAPFMLELPKFCLLKSRANHIILLIKG